MSKFIELSDYDASIHREILDALTREDDAVVEICEDRAVAEMRCYLSRRYDCDKIFTATGDKRNQLVLMMAIDIAVYHIFCIHNPRNLSPLRKERHERAGRKWLESRGGPRRYRWTACPAVRRDEGGKIKFLIKATVNV